jgi:hypothetical protein
MTTSNLRDHEISGLRAAAGARGRGLCGLRGGRDRGGPRPRHQVPRSGGGPQRPRHFKPRNRDDWFPASLSWSSSEGFNGRVTNNSWRELQPTAQAADE